jgi:ABC-2 type transport system permease protein
MPRRSLLSQVLAAVLVNAVYEMKNYPIVLVNTILSPLSFLLLVVFVTHGSLLGTGIIGGFVMSMFSSGMTLQTDLAHLKNDFKLQDMLVSSPVKWHVYMFGIALSEIVYAMPALVALALLAAYYTALTLAGVVQLTLVLALMFLASMSIGYTLSTFSSDIVQSFAFSRLLSTLFSTLPPVYYPLAFIPMPYRLIAYLSPTTYAAELAHAAAGYASPSAAAVATDWTVLVALTLVLFAIAKKKARWREI